MPTIRPFTIDTPQAQLDDLRERLERTRWPHTIDGHDFGGPPIAAMRRRVERLLALDWRRRERELNRFAQFTTEIDGEDLHFVHVRSRQEDATPLLLIHGWPGSIVEFLHQVAPLTDPLGHGGTAEDAFHVVIPSLPGFGFSGPPRGAGWNNGRIARALLELMSLLGYERFAVQGGDAGAIIGPEIARLAPARVIGVHVNAATLGFIPMGPVSEDDAASFSEVEKRRLAFLQEFVQVKFGFNLIQSHQPQLLAYAISDSPVGLMAWLAQLFDEPDDDAFLTNFMAYWLTGTASSSIRLYYENAHDPAAWAPKASSGVPTAVGVFGDGDVAIRRYGEAANNIVRWTDYPRGGHYAALVEPELWLRDVRESFRAMRALA
jgi:epoxide hydrolase